MKTWKNFKKLFFNPYFLICLTLTVIFIIYYIYINWISAPDFLKIITPEQTLEDYQAKLTHSPKWTTKNLEIYSQIVRNRGWLIWMIISLLGLLAGIILTTWGRIIQIKSDLNERYEKAASMMGNGIMAVRIAGCRAFMVLATDESIDDEAMKSVCVHLLFSFIRNQKEETIDNGEFLNADIQEAANSFSAIYDHYEGKGINNKQFELPNYFLKNKMKSPISLIRANLKKIEWEGAHLEKINLQNADLKEAKLKKTILEEAKLQKANLFHAELQEVNLKEARLQNVNLSWAHLEKSDLTNAELKKANMHNTYLKGADITNAKMKNAKNLTKEQILSAKWGLNEEEEGKPPSLPKKIMKDPEVKKWLITEHYNKKEEAEAEAEAEAKAEEMELKYQDFPEIRHEQEYEQDDEEW